MNEERKIYGYARISEGEENEKQQLVALIEAGVPIENIFIDRSDERKNYERLLELLWTEDVVYIKSIDRLSLRIQDAVTEWYKITQEKGASIVVTDIPFLDTSKTNNLSGEQLADMVYGILSSCAESMKKFRHIRQKIGYERAREKGIVPGKKRIPKPPTFEDVYKQHINGEITLTEAAKLLNVSRQTFSKWKDERTEELLEEETQEGS